MTKESECSVCPVLKGLQIEALDIKLSTVKLKDGVIELLNQILDYRGENYSMEDYQKMVWG